MPSALDRVLDAIDVETFLVCASKDEGIRLGLRLMKELGFEDADVVSCEYAGPGARVRLRAYLSRPGAPYPWAARLAPEGDGHGR